MHPAPPAAIRNGWIVPNRDFRPGSEGLSVAEVDFEAGTIDGRTGYGYTRAARVWQAADAPRDTWFPIVLHELVHSLAGLNGHVPQSRFPDSIMRDQYGDLANAIDVIGNRFRETGGDVGDLNGMFVGAGHEGAVGTLERNDLTAAFGATR